MSLAAVSAPSVIRSLGVKSLGQPQCFLLDLDVFIQAHQVRIEPGDASHCVDHLLSEHHVRDPLVIFRDADESAIQLDSEAAQQRLGNGEPQAGIQNRIVSVPGRVGG